MFKIDNVVMNTKKMTFGQTVIKHTARGVVIDTDNDLGLVKVRWFVSGVDTWKEINEVLLVNDDIKDYP